MERYTVAYFHVAGCFLMQGINDHLLYKCLSLHLYQVHKS